MSSKDRPIITPSSVNLITPDNSPQIACPVEDDRVGVPSISVPLQIAQFDGQSSPLLSETLSTADPPSVDDIITKIKILGCKPQEQFQDLVKFSLSPSNFEALKARLEQDPTINVRYDYDPETQEFVLRMILSTYHDGVVVRVAEALEPQLRSLVTELEGKDDDAQELLPAITFAKGLERRTGPLTVGKGTKSPDCMFVEQGMANGGLVIEVKYSQSADDLREITDNYLYDTDDQVAAVLTVILPYKPRKEQALSMNFYILQRKATSVGKEVEYVHEVKVACYDNNGEEVATKGGASDVIEFDLNAFGPITPLVYEGTPLRLTRGDLLRWEWEAWKLETEPRRRPKRAHPEDRERVVSKKVKPDDEYHASGSTSSAGA